jgi:putative membrane protein
MNYMGNGSGALMVGWMALWALVALSLLALAVAGTVWLIRSGRSADTGPPRGRSQAEDILRSRYAAGEIGEDEFLRRLSGLGQ